MKKTVIILLAVAFIGLQGCEKKGIVEETKIFTENDFKFSKSFETNSKSLVQAKFELFSDNEDLLEQGNRIIIQAVFEEMPIGNSDIIISEEEVKKEVENKKTDFYLNITDIKLPEGSKGYKVILPSNTDKAWDLEYSWNCGTGTWDAKKLRVTKTNNRGNVQVKIGVLKTSSQWFYYSRVSTRLRNDGEDVSYSPPTSYYKVRLRVDLNYGGNAEYTVWYQGGTVYTGDV